MNNRLRTTVIIVIVLIVALLGYTVVSSLGFKIKSVSPRAKNITTLTPYIEVNFTQKLGANSESHFTAESGVITKTTIEGSKAKLFLGTLVEKKTYHIKITGLASAGGKMLGDKDIVFTPKYVSFDSLSNSDQQKVLDNQNTQKGAALDPILTSLPYGGVNFQLDADLGEQKAGDTVTLKAQLLLSKADLSDEPAAIATYKEDVNSYIKSLGLDPTKYKIDYEVVEPSVY